MSEVSTVDRIAMYVGGGLVLAGVVGVGLLELAVGAASPVTEEGQVVAGTLVPVDVRAGIVVLGIAVWGLCALSKVVGTPRAAGIDE